MSAPTLWEEGTTPGGRVVGLAAACTALLVLLDLWLTGRLSPLFDVALVLLSIGAALLVRPRDFFTVGVMPPFLALAVLVVLGLVAPGAIAGADDGLGQALVAGLAHHSAALFAADVLVLAVIGIRLRVRSVHGDRTSRRPYSNLEASPAPNLTTSGEPEEKSTTVVGSEVVSPPSSTASSF